jgi:hypothetical protein
MFYLEDALTQLEIVAADNPGHLQKVILKYLYINIKNESFFYKFILLLKI